MKRMFQVTLLLLAFAATAELCAQVVTPFSVRYQTNDKGTIQLVGNTSMTCPAGGCSGINNSYNMRYVDIDADASTFNSSSAVFTLPAGGTVLWAGLYWNGVPNSGAKQNVKFKAPGASSYSILTGTLFNSSYGYQAFKEVTAQVQSAGSGNYTVADVQSNTGTNTWGGWALVVVVRDPALPMRNLTVFDGFALVSGSNPNVTLTINGFQAPPAGAVNVELGVIAYDGDNGSTGDVFKLNGSTITNAVNPSNDFFNSTISRMGTLLTAKNPNYSNQLGLDIDVINASGLIANSATSATINLTTGGESYLPGVVTSAIDLYAPDINMTKSITDINGGQLVPGDTLVYSVSLTNSGMDGAASVVVRDSVRAYQAFIPGSLQITSGPNSGTKTDGGGDDQADFSSGIATFRLGTGANAAAGGTIAPAATTAFTFKTVVTQPVPDSTAIENRATVAYKSQSIPIRDFSGESNLTQRAVASKADLSLTKSVSNASPVINGNITYTLTLSNAGPNIATGVTVQELLPAGLTFLGYSATGGATYDNIGGTWDIGTMLPSSTRTLQITAQVTGTTPITNTAEIKSSDQGDPDSSPNNGQPGEDDIASVTITPLVTSDLSIRKTATPLNPSIGDTLTYRLVVKNEGPAPATGIVIKDSLPGGITYLGNSASQGTWNPGTGYWSVGSIANGDSAVLTITSIMNVATPVTNRAAITASDQPDPDGLDRADSVTVPQQISDLSLSKTVSPTNPLPGQNVVYTLTVLNGGPNKATGVTVTDQLPAGVSYVSHNANTGTYTPGSGEWQIGSVAVTDTAALQITATVSAGGIITNSAAITFSHQADPDSADRAASASLTGQQADLSITKSVSDTLPANNSTITYTVTVHNSGPAAATNVTVTDILPAGLLYLASVPSQGIYDTATGVWNIGTVASGANAVLSISVKVLYANFQNAVFNLGPATGFNAFIINDMLQPSADTQGKLAVGHNATLSNYSVGDQLPSSAGTDDVLIVGNNLIYTSGGVWGGNVVYGNTSNLPSYAVTVFDGTVRKDSVIDFAAAKTDLQNLSLSLASSPINGLVTNDWNKLTLTGSDPFLNVFHVQGSLLNSTHTMEINVPGGSTVLVNIDGTGMNWHGGLFVNGTAINNVLYNFYQADTMVLFGMDVRGTILAPFASVHFPAGVINGQAVFYNMTGSGQFNHSRFVGNIPVNHHVQNIAEISSADQNDPDSSPGNGNGAEDDIAAATIHLSNLGSFVSGSGWQLAGSFPQNEIILCVGHDGNGDMLAGTLGGKIHRTTNGGTTWTHINSSMATAFIWSLLKAKDNSLYAATEAGIYRSTDNGANWAKLTAYGNYDTRSVVCDTSGYLYAAAWGFGIYKSTDNGATWVTAKAGMTSLAITSLSVSAENELYAGNLGDGVLKSVDGGSTWVNLNVPYNFVWSVAAKDSGEVLAGTYGYGLYISSTGGTNWYKSTGIPSSAYIYAITIDSAGNKYAASWMQGVYYLPAGSLSMRPMGLEGMGINTVLVDQKSGNLMASSRDGKIYRYLPGVTGVESEGGSLPNDYALMQNYPNPFNPLTTISYALPEAGRVTLQVFDVMGRVIAQLVDEQKAAGQYQVTFDASRLASGIYFYSLHANGHVITKKMIFLK